MIEMVSTISQPSLRYCARHMLGRSSMCIRLRALFGRGRKCTVSRTIWITVIGISLILITDDVFHAASPPGGGLAGVRHSARASHHQRRDTDDDAYQQLQTLLGAVDQRSSCRQQALLGGRGFTCEMKDGVVLSSVDGFKPICLDWLQSNCSALSFGINNDFTFDDAMEDLGCTVHAFDPTMGMGSFRRSEGIHFHSVGIGAEDGQLGGFPVASLGTIVRQAGLGSGIIDYVKLDVESSEWEVLKRQLTTSGDLLRVKQLAIEFHLWRWSPVLTEGAGFEKGEENSLFISGENARRFVDVLSALQTAGFVLTHTINSVSCQSYKNGCLSFIYETVWANAKISSQNVIPV